MQNNPANWIIWQTLMKDNPANRQVGNDQTPQITLFDGFSSLTDYLRCLSDCLAWFDGLAQKKLAKT